MLYWGVGNPRPDFDASTRHGDNLYSDSVVALRGTTGQLLWHFQFTPGDTHDWDSNQTPLIADRNTAQGLEKRLLWANRNGFYYVLDRESGAFRAGRAVRRSRIGRRVWIPRGGRCRCPKARRERAGRVDFSGREGRYELVVAELRS